MSNMDSCSRYDKVVTNSNSPSKLTELSEIKKEKEEVDQELYPKHEKYYDYDFEPFHENIFRTLSCNFDNASNIAEVNDAYSKLESCFIENKILTKTGESKLLKEVLPDNFFSKYRDIDDAFLEMVISESTVIPINENAVKKIDLRSFKENIFTVKDNEQSFSDNEQSQSKEGYESDGQEDCEFLEDSQSCHEDSECEILDFPLDDNDLSYAEALSFELNSNLSKKCEIQNESCSIDRLHSTDDNMNEKSDLNVSQLAINSKSPRTETVRDIRVVIQKLPNLTEPTLDDLTIITPIATPKCATNAVSQKEARQVARKKTGGVVLSNLDQDVNRDQKVVQQHNNKEGDFAPSVFDKMTRAGKRDLERALAESTANLVIQKTTLLIQEKMKEFRTQDKFQRDSDGSGSEDEAKESDIHKTAEIVTNTIIEFLSKNKNKKLEKLGKEITDEINNKINNLNAESEGITPISVIKQASVSPNKIIQPPTASKMDKQEDKKIVEQMDDNENTFRRITRESTRAITSRQKNVVKRKTSGSRKVSVSALREMAKIEKQMIASWEKEIQPTEEEATKELEQPRRPETRQSKLIRESNALQQNFQEKRILRSSRKSFPIFEKKAMPKKSSDINKKDLDDGDSLTGETYIDGQFLIDSEISGDPPFAVSNSDFDMSNSIVGKLQSTNEELIETSDRTILKASADSTTMEISMPISEVISNLANSEGFELDQLKDRQTLLSQSPDSQINISEVMNLEPSFKSKYLDHETNKKENEPVPEIEPTVGNVNSSAYKSNAVISKMPIQNVFLRDNLNQNSGMTSIKSNVNLNIKSTSRTAENEVPIEVLTGIIEKVEKKLAVENFNLSSINEKDDEELSSPKAEAFVDSTSFLNYTLDDSFKLMIDDSFLEKGEIKNNNLITSEDSVTSEKSTINELPKEKICDVDYRIIPNIERGMFLADKNCIYPMIANDILKEIVQRREFEEVIAQNGKIAENPKDATINSEFDSGEKSMLISKKPLTNEEKIAQLTKRDPRLLNDKKIESVRRRDPRIRNKLAKPEEMTQQKPHPEEVAKQRDKPEDLVEQKPQPEEEIKVKPQSEVMDSPLSPEPEHCIENPLTHMEIPTGEKHIIEQSSTQSDSNESYELSRKKRFKKAVDTELLYKTPLSDLHESSNERPTYSRIADKKKRVPNKKNRDMSENLRTISQPPCRSVENEDRGSFKHPNIKAEDNFHGNYYNHEYYDDRNFHNSDEGNPRAEEEYHNREYEDRNFYQNRDLEYQCGPREDYEYQQSYHERRTRNEENFNVVNERREMQDNEFYSRREFFRRDKFSHDHDHRRNNRFSAIDKRFQRHEDSFYQQQSQETFGVTADSVYRVSAYPPVSLLPDPMLNHEEGQEPLPYGNMLDADSFSPPSSDMCPPPPPLIRSPTPEHMRRENYCPSPPHIGRVVEPDDNVERNYVDDDDDYNGRHFERNHERGDQRSYRGNRSNSHRGGNNGRYWRNSGRGDDYHRRDDSPPPARNRFGGHEYHEEDRAGPSGRWRRSPSWSPERTRRWSRERSPLSPPESRPWDSPPSPRWYDNYRDRGQSYKNYRY